MTKEIQYPEIIHNHYSYRDMIDNHNLSRMHPISMEESWMMMHWANHIFCFLLAVTVKNIKNMACYFLNKSKMDALQSCHLIAKQFIFYCHLEQEQASRKCPRRCTTAHTLIMVLTHKKFIRGRMVTCKTKYGKWKCTDCSKFVHSYCSCTVCMCAISIHCYNKMHKAMRQHHLNEHNDQETISLLYQEQLTTKKFYIW